MKKALFVSAILIIIAISIFVAMILTSNREASGGQVLTRDGSRVELRAVPGAPMTLVHFWGTWCGPCKRELPELEKFRTRYASKGVAFITIADDPDFETVNRFLRAEGLSFDVLLDPNGSAGRAWNVSAYPTTFVIGPDDAILARYVGPVDWASGLQRREILRLAGLEP